MSPTLDRNTSRRHLLKFLAAGPLFAHLGAPAFAADHLRAVEVAGSNVLGAA